GLCKQHAHLVVIQSFRAPCDFGEREMLLLEQSNELDPRDVSLRVSRPRPRRAGWRQQPLLYVEMNRARRHVRAFAQFGDVEVGHRKAVISVYLLTVKSTLRWAFVSPNGSSAWEG